MRTLVDAFTGSAALGPEGRAALGRAVGWGRAAVDHAPLGDLADRRHRRELADALMSAAAGDDVLPRLADATFAELAPGTSLLPDAPIGAHHCGVKAFDLLARHGVGRWSTLLGLRVGAVRSWPDCGAGPITEIVGMVFERSLLGLASAQQETSLAATVDLAILADHEQATSRQPLRAALTELSGEGQPEIVRQAAARLLRMVPAAGHVRVLSDILAAAGDARHVDVFVDRTLTLTRRPTIEEVGQRFGVSTERVRQIRTRAQERVRACAAAAPDHSRALLGAVGSWLGTVVPVDVADDVVRRLGAGSARTRVGGLLLWLAGPYRPVPGHDGWLALDPAQIAARTAEWLAADGGVRPAQEIRDELAAGGVRAEHRDAWLAACGGVGVEDMVVSTAGGIAAVAERVLFAAGHAMPAGEIAALLAAHPRASELAALLRRDKRFVRTAADVYELAEWGGSAAPPLPAPAVATTGGVTSIDGRWWLRVPVSEDVLRGGSRPIPVGLAEAMSLADHHRRTFGSRYGPVTIIDDTASPGLGSLRPVALACGAQPGDDLWLGFDPTGEVTVQLRNGDDQPHAAVDGFLAGTRSPAIAAQGAR